MGQYFIWYNHAKQEYLDGDGFGEGIKLFANSNVNAGCINAVLTLMLDEWKGDKIVCFGDYWTEKPADNTFLQKIKNEIDDHPYDYALDHFEDKAVIFATANKKGYAEDVKRAKEFGEEYGYRGPMDLSDLELFSKETVFVNYVINHTKQEYYDRSSKRLSDDENEKWFDPTGPLLMAAKGLKPYIFGVWIGDELEVTNDVTYVTSLGYRDCTNVYSFQHFFEQDEK